jgi:hypothetical protein
MLNLPKDIRTQHLSKPSAREQKDYKAKKKRIPRSKQQRGRYITKTIATEIDTFRSSFLRSCFVIV